MQDGLSEKGRSSEKGEREKFSNSLVYNYVTFGLQADPAP